MSGTEPPSPGPESEWVPAWDADTGPQPSQSGPRSHRAPIGIKQLAERLLAPVGAVAVVVIVIGLLIWINGRPPGGHSSASVAVATAPTKLLVPSNSPSPSLAPTTTSPTPSNSPSAKKSPKPKKSPVVKKSSHSAPPPADRNAMAVVQVLNNSRITGLAHEVAAQVEARGWRIGIIGNMQGALPVTTVFYSPGDEAAAQHLAREFPSIQSIQPNAVAHLTQTGITLVLTRDWVS